MGLGITGASITNFTNGTTADGPSVSTNDQQLKTWGVNNDGVIQTDGSGNMTVVSVANGQGIIRGIFFLTTPYQFATNASQNSTTVTYTIVGNGTPSVPSGAKAALVSCYYLGGAAGNYIQMVAHGQSVTNPSNWPLMGQAQVSSGSVAATAIVPLDSNGKLDVIASGNITSIYASVYGYIY